MQPDDVRNLADAASKVPDAIRSGKDFREEARTAPVATIVFVVGMVVTLLVVANTRLVSR